VPGWVISQLKAMNTSYPIAWDENDLSASWLSPGRLLLFLEAAVSKEPAAGLPRVSQGSYTPPTTAVSVGTPANDRRLLVVSGRFDSRLLVFPGDR